MSERDPRLSELYRQASGEEPPERLDALIAEQARRALAEAGARPPAPWWKRWAVPLGAAAALVLAVAITRIIEREQPASVDSPEGAPGQSAREAPPGPQEPRAPAPESSRPGVADRAGGPPSPAAAGRAAPEPRIGPAGQPKAEDPAAVLRSAETGAPAPRAAESAGPPAPVAPRPVPAEAAKRSAEPAREAAPPAAGIAPAAPAARQDREPTGHPAARSPEEWVERVRAARRDGRAQEAERLLAELRRRHPDFPLPDDLR